MRRNRFSVYLILQAIVIALVMVIFKVVPDRRLASVLAGSLFVVLPLGLMAFELFREGFKRWYWFLGTLQFWLLFAVPILGLRLTHWREPFVTLEVFGVPAPFLHQWSSKSYMLWMVVTLGTSWYLNHKMKKPG